MSSMADATSLRTKITTRARQAQVIASAGMKTHYRRAAPHKTGATQESVDVINFTSGPSELRCTAVATTPQAKFTDAGTEPHVIRPRRAKALRFRYRGRIVYAQKVNHPGNKGTRWFRNTGPRHWHDELQNAYQRLG